MSIADFIDKFPLYRGVVYNAEKDLFEAGEPYTIGADTEAIRLNTIYRGWKAAEHRLTEAGRQEVVAYQVRYPADAEPVWEPIHKSDYETWLSEGNPRRELRALYAAPTAQGEQDDEDEMTEAEALRMELEWRDEKETRALARRRAYVKWSCEKRAALEETVDTLRAQLTEAQERVKELESRKRLIPAGWEISHYGVSDYYSGDINEHDAFGIALKEYKAALAEDKDEGGDGTDVVFYAALSASKGEKS